MYSLLKQLKEAGFPQKQEFQYYAPDCDCGFAGKYRTNEESYDPTTDELIEELGAFFESLERKENWIAKAHSLNKKENWQYHQDPYERYESQASTPKEALINLHIELHKKWNYTPMSGK